MSASFHACPKAPTAAEAAAENSDRIALMWCCTGSSTCRASGGCASSSQSSINAKQFVPGLKLRTHAMRNFVILISKIGEREKPIGSAARFAPPPGRRFAAALRFRKSSSTVYCANSRCESSSSPPAWILLSNGSCALTALAACWPCAKERGRDRK